MFKKFSFKKMADDEYRYRTQMLVIPALVGFVSLCMTILNFFSHKEPLTYITFGFFIACIIDEFIVIFYKKNLVIPHFVFSFTVILLFICLIVTGGTEGFSPIWVLLLPSYGLLFMGKFKGTIFCAVMFSVIIFFFWTPWGLNLLQYKYTDSFLLRFPLVYIGFFVLGYFFESVRSSTNKALILMQKKYKEISIRDAVTTIYNRYWFNEQLRNSLSGIDNKPICLMILDIDRFKSYNDKYGHLFGDEVLKKIALLLEEKSENVGMVCRWGGEEFAVLMEKCSEEKLTTHAEILRKAIESLEHFSENGEIVKITISIGAVCLTCNQNSKPDQLVKMADDALYSAKNCGRNCTRIVIV